MGVLSGPRVSERWCDLAPALGPCRQSVMVARKARRVARCAPKPDDTWVIRFKSQPTSTVSQRARNGNWTLVQSFNHGGIPAAAVMAEVSQRSGFLLDRHQRSHSVECFQWRGAPTTDVVVFARACLVQRELVYRSRPRPHLRVLWSGKCKPSANEGFEHLFST
jgi:hypothetical protein